MEEKKSLPEPSRFYLFLRPILPKALQPLVLRYQELVSYVFFGVGTCLVNLLVYFPLERVCGYLAANCIAWIAAVIFAYVTNKLLVFESPSWEARVVIREASGFFAARLMSLGLEELMLAVMIGMLGISSTVTKLSAQVVVVLFNYIASKFFIFKKKKTD